MLPYLVLGTALLAGLLLAGRWYATADPRSLVKVLKWALVGVVLLIILFFVVTGRLGWAIASLPALLPWFLRARSAARMAKTFARMAQPAGAGAGGRTNSEVKTRYLHMSLDHTTGRMSGKVLCGKYSGQSVEVLKIAQLIELLQVFRHDDHESARVLEAYMDREFNDWRETDEPRNQPNSPESTVLDRAAALQILGLEEGASKENIKEAYRRLIAGIHPDHGGSDYLAAQINLAKDVLLKE